MTVLPSTESDVNSPHIGMGTYPPDRGSVFHFPAFDNSNFSITEDFSSPSLMLLKALARLCREFARITTL